MAATVAPYPGPSGGGGFSSSPSAPAPYSTAPADMADYWAECQDMARHRTYYEEPQHYEEGEQEAEWLCAAGLAQLARPFQAGREAGEAEVTAALRRLPRTQAAAARRRVRALNHTLRRQRARRPDIRDVFREQENSSGSEPRSRSATPDSLDSLPSGGSGSPPTEWADPTSHSISESYSVLKQPLYRTPSAPPSSFSPLSPLPPSPPRRDPDLRDSSGLSPPSHYLHVPVHELFKPSELHWADVASNTEGIELLGYQRFGTIQGPRLGRERLPTAILLQDNQTLGRKQSHSSIARAHSVASERLGNDKSNLSRASSHEVLSFEQKFKKDSDHYIVDEMWPEDGLATNIEELSETQLKRLTPLLWLDLTALYDRHNLPFQKRKAYKKKRKEENNVFGVSLLTLVRKDHVIAEEAVTNVPRILRLLIDALSNKVYEEGILRVAGNKHKVEVLCSEIERNFYSEPHIVEECIAAAGCHDLAATLKRFLRELPQPILSTELVQLFYQTHALDGAAQGRALNLLVLLMSFEHRATLQELVLLLQQISHSQASNKMSEHNVAMIIAPTLFPPSLVIRPTDGLEAQLQMAANSCRVTEAMMKFGSSLWLVPPTLASQLNRKPHVKRTNGQIANNF